MGELKITTRLWKALARQVERKVDDKGKAEDYLSSAYIKMREYQATSPIRDEAAFLKRTAHNLAIDERRSAAARLTSSKCVSDLIEIRDANPLPDEVLIVQQRLENVRSRLMRLNPRTREIFLMHRLDGLKHREIADQLGISVSAVEKHIAKAAYSIT